MFYDFVDTDISLKHDKKMSRLVKKSGLDEAEYCDLVRTPWIVCHKTCVAFLRLLYCDPAFLFNTLSFLSIRRLWIGYCNVSPIEANERY